MNHAEFSFDDVVPYLNQELPGFEPKLMREENNMTTLRVRTTIDFASYQSFSDELVFALYGSRSLKITLDEYIRKTRQQVIEKLGLQKEIDETVQRKLNFERDKIRQEEYQKAYSKALREVAQAAAESPSLSAISAFLHPKESGL